MKRQKKEAAQQGHAANNVQENNNTCTDNKSIFDGISLEPYREWSLLETFINSFSKDQQEQSFEEMPFVKTVILESIKEFIQDPQGFIKRVDKEKLFKFLQENRAEFDTNLYNAITVFCGHKLEERPLLPTNKDLNNFVGGLTPARRKLTAAQKGRLDKMLDFVCRDRGPIKCRPSMGILYYFCLNKFLKLNYFAKDPDTQQKKKGPLQTEFRFTRAEYFKYIRQIKNYETSASVRKNFNLELRADLYTLESISTNLTPEKGQKNDVPLLLPSEINGDIVKIKFHGVLAKYISDNEGLHRGHPALYKLTNKHPQAWSIGQYLCEKQTNFGYKGRFEHKILVGELIDILGLTYDSKAQGWRTTIKKRLETHLNKLKDIGFFDNWHYIDSFTGEKMNEKNIKNYAEFRKIYVYFEVSKKGIRK